MKTRALIPALGLLLSVATASGGLSGQAGHTAATAVMAAPTCGAGGDAAATAVGAPCPLGSRVRAAQADAATLPLLVGGAPLATVVHGPTELLEAGIWAQSAGGSHWRRGAVAGLVIGTAATVFVLWQGDSTALCDQSANQDAMRPRDCAAFVALGGAVGAGLGALVGSRIRRGG